MATDTWPSISWKLQTSPGGSSLLHKHLVPYRSKASALQNLDVWIPITTSEVPDASTLPVKKGIWVIYIHGGAWRDPLVNSSSFAPTVAEIASKHSGIFSNIAGIASIDYSLSPRSREDAATNDPSQKAAHPDHIIDVLTGLSYLQKLVGFGSNYILLGHSCGATLAFQVAMDHEKWNCPSTLKVAKPVAIIGLNGLYDMPTLIREPGEKHLHLQAIYQTFTRLAFGDDEEVWNTISPISVCNWEKEWQGGRKAVLVQSKEDSLVPYWQLEDLRKKLLVSKGSQLEVSELEAGGDHNDLWEEGGRLAEIIDEVAKSLR